MRFLHVTLTIALLGLVPRTVHAQATPSRQGELTGVVIDSRTDRPLRGVRVSFDKLPLSTDTDADGRFRLMVDAGQRVLVVSLVGYAMVRQTLEIAEGENPPLTIRLSEGAGEYSEQVTVAGDTRSEGARTAGAAALHGGDLQALRGVTLDDPIRAVHLLPSVTATDDFYSEFAVRGSPFRHVGLVVDGVPSQYLMHAVHGVSDGGSIAMINTDALGSILLMLPPARPRCSEENSGCSWD